MARTIGFRDVYIAKVTKNDATGYTADTPVKLAKSISGKFAEKFNVEKNYADDQLDEILRSFDSVDIELEITKLTPEQREILFGQKVTKGVAVANANDIAQDFAIGFRAKNSNGKYEFYWYYVCSCESPDERNFETVADKPKSQNPKLKITGRAREIDSNYRVMIDETVLLETDTEAKALLAVDATSHLIKWFEDVVEPLAA
jgi:phi13 family phage major tail protein